MCYLRSEMLRQCELCASRPAVTLVPVANGSSVAVCFECATGQRSGAVPQSASHSMVADVLREPRSSPVLAGTHSSAPRTTPARKATAKRACVQCRKKEVSGKKTVCSSCRRRNKEKRRREVEKLHGQELATAKTRKTKKKKKGNPCFTSRQFRGGIVQGGLPSLGKRS
jgi:hypothetical protein